MNGALIGYLWILPLMLCSAFGSYFAKLSNSQVPYSWIGVLLLSFFGSLMWVWVSRISQNLLFDSILFDVIMLVVFTAGLIILKCGESFTGLNWVGLILTMVGLILMKVK